MASRRDELNAYTFEKKRTVASFLQPSPTGTDEGAPRPLRGFLPGLIVAALLLAGFGAVGMFKPQAPKGWDAPGKNVIVGSDSTTRYVVLTTKGKTQLHPILNLASAKLLLDTDSFGTVKVAEEELDSGKIPYGPTIGIPYAPDRLPSEAEARSAKRWAVCEKPSGKGRAAQRATFVLADREKSSVEGRDRVHGGQVMYVREQGGDAEYLVDAQGKKYELKERQHELLVRTIVNGAPQHVSKEWLATLKDGTPIAFPKLRGEIDQPAGVPGLARSANRIGMVLRASTADGPEHYLVERERIVRITDLTAQLILHSPDTKILGQDNAAMAVQAQEITPAAYSQSPTASFDWPTIVTKQVNRGSRDTMCSVLRDVDPDTGTTSQSTWVAKDYPRTIPDRSTSAYVTPGSGLLFRQFQGSNTGTGNTFLMTDTGLRYAVQANTDSSSDATPQKPKKDSGGDTVNEAQIRLGYQAVKPLPVPIEWTQFLPTGPRLDTNSARQPQGS